MSRGNMKVRYIGNHAQEIAVVSGTDEDDNPVVLRVMTEPGGFVEGDLSHEDNNFLFDGGLLNDVTDHSLTPKSAQQAQPDKPTTLSSVVTTTGDNEGTKGGNS